MRLLIYSDLHLEFADFTPPTHDADVVVLAGDIHIGVKGIRWAIEYFPNQHVIYVLDNHEYYGQAYPKHIQKMQEFASGTNVRVLENNCLEIDGMLFLGCTLWTDFELMGDPKIAGAYATERITDYRKIRVAPEYRKLRSFRYSHHASKVITLARLGSSVESRKTVRGRDPSCSERQISTDI